MRIENNYYLLHATHKKSGGKQANHVRSWVAGHSELYRNKKLGCYTDNTSEFTALRNNKI